MSYKIFDYFICPIRKYFVLYIDKGSINSGEYLCHMIVNNNIVLDKRYKYIVDKNNILYNLIYIGDPKVNILPKKENNVEKTEKKSKKKKNKNKNKIVINDTDNDNDFFYYCYNENSNSTNSYSTKSDLKTKKDNTLENNNQNINELLKNNKKTHLKKNTSKLMEYLKINTGNVKENKKYVKKNNLSTYSINKLSKNNELKDNNVYLYENHNSIKEDSIQSQRIKYINILDELCPSVSSFSRTTFSMKNINAYSKKTHQTKFCSNNKNITKIPKKKGLDKKTENLGDLYIHTITSSKFKTVDNY